jgi:IMP dehydrogenase
MRFNKGLGDEVAITFDDVCLVPQFSTVKSRNDIDLTNGSLNLRLPIISANMDTVTEARMAIEMHKNGGLGIIHRFMNFESLTDEVHKFYLALNESGADPYSNLAISVGTNKDSYGMLDYCLQHARIICIDIAHGHSEHVVDMIRAIRHKSKKTIIIAGNVATPEGVGQLAIAGAHIIKCGVGPGSMCTTRVITGHGVPQLSVIDLCAKEAAKHGAEIIADGGLRNSGDMAKAFAAGATYVMAGSLLSATDESPGEIVMIDDNRYKQYRGMASFDAQAAIGKDTDRIVPEGASRFKKCTGPVENILFQLAGGLRSALSYSGCHRLREFSRIAEFVRISPSSKAEGEPHGLIER